MGERANSLWSEDCTPMKKYKRVPRPTDDLMGVEQGI